MKTTEQIWDLIKLVLENDGASTYRNLLDSVRELAGVSGGGIGAQHFDRVLGSMIQQGDVEEVSPEDGRAVQGGALSDYRLVR
jgi:hypothetical protein